MNCLCGLCVQYGCECTITGDHTGCLCACGDEETTEEELKKKLEAPIL